MSAKNATSAVKLFSLPAKILIMESTLPYFLEERISKNNPTISIVRVFVKMVILGIEIEFYVDLDDRHKNVSMDTVVKPLFNYPSFVVTQLGLHNNYASMSPYQNGVELQGGKQYEITLKLVSMH
ncbi:uncharacterized protein TNCV_2844051 [Trichonephila clavipes]|nr:uncharacterized protein TNCV_2844051 [Trichonephila clavipes]